MTLVQSWIDSLQLLKPKNLQLFALVTLKSIIEAYKLLFKYFWWLIVLQLLCYKFGLFGSYFFVVMIAVIQNLLFFMICAITRPSIGKKDCAYFRSQLYPFAYFAAFWTLLIAIGYFLGIVVPEGAELLPVFVWTVFSMLFFLDAEKSVKSFCVSLWYALKMILFNLPIVLCMYFAIYIFNASVVWLVGLLMDAIYQGLLMLGMKWIWMKDIVRWIVHHSVLLILQYALVPLLLLPIGICTYANIYIKKLHDQFDLYFTQPQ